MFLDCKPLTISICLCLWHWLSTNCIICRTCWEFGEAVYMNRMHSMSSLMRWVLWYGRIWCLPVPCTRLTFSSYKMWPRRSLIRYISHGQLDPIFKRIYGGSCSCLLVISSSNTNSSGCYYWCFVGLLVWNVVGSFSIASACHPIWKNL